MESINYEGYEIVKTRDGKYLIVDWYEYYDTLAEAKQEIRKFIGDVEATDFNKKDSDESLKEDVKDDELKEFDVIFSNGPNSRDFERVIVKARDMDEVFKKANKMPQAKRYDNIIVNERTKGTVAYFVAFDYNIVFKGKVVDSLVGEGRIAFNADNENEAKRAYNKKYMGKYFNGIRPGKDNVLNDIPTENQGGKYGKVFDVYQIDSKPGANAEDAKSILECKGIQCESKEKEKELNINLKETRKNERQFIKEQKKMKEGYTLLGNEDKEILAYSNYYNAEKKAKELGLKLAEYGDVYGSNVSYAFWNKSGNRNEDEEVMCYYFFDKDGKPRADVTETELSQIAKAFGIPKSDIDDADEVIDDENLEESKSKNDKWEIEWDYNHDVKDAPWFAIIVYNDKTNRNKFKADISLEDAKKLGLEDDGDEGFGDFTSFKDLEKIVGHKLKFERINEECKESVKRSSRNGKSLKKDKVIVFGKDTKLKEEARKIPYGLLAWQLNEIISGMDNEEAYWGPWIDIWPDGSTRQSAIEDFGTKEEYEELEDLFKKVYKAYHRDGLYNVSKQVLDRAHKWDKKLGLKPIVDIKYEKLNKFEDDYEEKIGEELNKAGIENDAFDIKEERDDGADYSYKALYFYDNATAKKAFNALKNSGEFASVTTYVEPSPDDFHSSIEVIVSEHKEEAEE